MLVQTLNRAVSTTQGWSIAQWLECLIKTQFE